MRYDLTPEQQEAVAQLEAAGLIRRVCPRESRGRCLVRLPLPPARPWGARGPVTPRW